MYLYKMIAGIIVLIWLCFSMSYWTLENIREKRKSDKEYQDYLEFKNELKETLDKKPSTQNHK